MAEDCVYNSMSRASCVHLLGSQTVYIITGRRSNIKGTELKATYELTKKRSLGGISGCEIGVFGKEKKEKGITCNSCYFTVKSHKIPLMAEKVIRNFLSNDYTNPNTNHKTSRHYHNKRR